MFKQNKPIGEILIEQGILAQKDLDHILSSGILKSANLRLGEALIQEGFITEKDLLKCLAIQYGTDSVDLDAVTINYKLASRMPLQILKKIQALPIDENDFNIILALSNPLNIDAQDIVQRAFPSKPIKIVLTTKGQIEKHINKLALSNNVKGLVQDIRREISSLPGQLGDNAAGQSSGVLKLVQVIVETAIASRGSDIHIEPAETSCIVRTRIDGILHETLLLDADIYPPLLSRIKILGNLDIAERRKPQDGRFSMSVNGKEYDFRLSTLPIINGESIVMRILDKSKVLIKLEESGMSSENLKRFNQSLDVPYGIIFITGPTGSGKTTTLYGALNAVKSMETKIITVEDPVEYQMPLIQQVLVNDKVGLTFASALRSILRQDPDVIMIGEVRDEETLRIAIQAALTGHLVFSTLHTNDAISAVTRILDMGIESYLVSGALIAIEAQRLVRKLCPDCKMPYHPPSSFIEKYQHILPEEKTFFQPKGCDSCFQTGYLGREMISEILTVNEILASMIARNDSKSALLEQATRDGYETMLIDGLRKAARGVTTIEEVFRVAKE